VNVSSKNSVTMLMELIGNALLCVIGLGALVIAIL
jgi:hypothetical protein